jgi:hypothetical protein
LRQRSVGAAALLSIGYGCPPRSESRSEAGIFRSGPTRDHGTASTAASIPREAVNPSGVATAAVDVGEPGCSASVVR